MPQVIFRYRSGWVIQANIDMVGPTIVSLVAEIANVPEAPCTVSHVEFLPQALEEGAIASNLAIEIRTKGYPERKKRIKLRIEQLKALIMAIPGFPAKAVDHNEPLIRVEFVDPDGLNV